MTSVDRPPSAEAISMLSDQFRRTMPPQESHRITMVWSHTFSRPYFSMDSKMGASRHKMNPILE